MSIVDVAIPPDWHRDRTAIIGLIHDLIDRGEIACTPDVLAAVAVVEKPEKYTAELARMLRDRAMEDQA